METQIELKNRYDIPSEMEEENINISNYITKPLVETAKKYKVKNPQRD